MRNKIFATIFCLFILLVMIGAPLNLALTKAGVIPSENVGNVIEVEKVYEDGEFGAAVLNAIEEFKRDVNDTYINYIPFYVDVTSAAKGIQRTLNNPVTTYLLNEGNRITLEQKENNDNDQTQDTTVLEDITTEPAEPDFEPIYSATYLDDDIFYRYYKLSVQEAEDEEPTELFLRFPGKDESELFDGMEAQATRINELAARVPEVNWYVFPVTCFEDSIMCEELLPTESKYDVFTQFAEKLDDSIQYDCVEMKTYSDKLTKYYHTDHHWNVYGYTEGYRRIATMMKENYPDIELKEPEIYNFDDQVTMYGSIALALSDYTMYDLFAAADYSLPKHQAIRESGVSYSGKNTIERSFLIYNKGIHNTERGYNHYMQFYMISREITYPENNTGRNLLIIGDSYSPPLLEVLASHFDKTYVRYVDGNSELQDIVYEDYIAEHGITDVVMLQLSSRVYCDYFEDSLNKIH